MTTKETMLKIQADFDKIKNTLTAIKESHDYAKTGTMGDRELKAWEKFCELVRRFVHTLTTGTWNADKQTLARLKAELTKVDLGFIRSTIPRTGDPKTRLITDRTIRMEIDILLADIKQLFDELIPDPLPNTPEHNFAITFQEFSAHNKKLISDDTAELKKIFTQS